MAHADNFETQSGKVLCAITPDSSIDWIGSDVVVCQGAFEQAPGSENAVFTTGTGSINWLEGNLAVFSPTTYMTYGHTYHRGGWTIEHDSGGTRLTLDSTGHGMFVALENVYAF